MEKSVFSREYRILCNLLRDARMKAGLTQEELADLLGETQSFVSKCERGERRLDIIQLHAFCIAMGRTLSAFVSEFEGLCAAGPKRNK
jgi:transcriptional regulator with XRE-family HTH domain